MEKSIHDISQLCSTSITLSDIRNTLNIAETPTRWLFRGHSHTQAPQVIDRGGEKRKEKTTLRQPINTSRTGFSFFPSIIHTAMTIFFSSSSPSSPQSKHGGGLPNVPAPFSIISISTAGTTAHKTTYSIPPRVRAHKLCMCFRMGEDVFVYLCVSWSWFSLPSPFISLTLP